MLRSLAAVGVSCVGAGIWTRFVEPHWLDVVNHTLRIPNLPPSLAGKRLVQISDLHVGSTSQSYLEEVFARVNNLRPDMITISGDFINHDSAGGVNDVARLLSSLTAPPLGTFACLGNHDYGFRWSQTAVAGRVAGAVQSSGVTLLRDESIDVAGLQIVGLDDLWSPRYAASGVLATIDPNRAALCLAHNPDLCDQPIWSAFRGVILSGHTHGGQCKPPFLPPPLLPVSNRRYVAGEYAIDPNKSLYITRGVGHTLTVRFNCRPELTVHTLV